MAAELPTPRVPFQAGDRILIKHDGRRIAGEVTLASPNGVSLMISFEAMIAGHVGMMPVLFRRGDLYFSIITETEIEILPRRRT